MKAERHHQLQTNALASKIIQVPDYSRKYAARAAVAVAVLVVIGYSVYRWFNAAATARNNAMMALVDARSYVDGMREPDSFRGRMALTAKTISTLRNNYEQGKLCVDQVLSTTSDPKLVAQAVLTRGDLDLALYQIPTPAGATTNEALKPTGATPPQNLVGQAETSYQEVLSKYPDHPLAVSGALMGLATIAEDRRDFAKAREFYTKLTQDAAVPQPLKALAQTRLETLASVETPAIFGDPNKPYTKLPVLPQLSPTSAKAATGPSTGATSAPAVTTTTTSSSSTTKPASASSAQTP